MKTFVTFVLSVGIVGTLAAQTDQKKMTASSEKDMAKPMMVTGCVAASGGMYKLDHAMMSADMKTMSNADMKSKHMMSYNLMGGDLKAHVGHKVEVTGTMAKDSMAKDGMHKDGMYKDMAKDKMPNDAMHKDAAGMMGGTLHVKSVKMISAVCP